MYEIQCARSVMNFLCERFIFEADRSLHMACAASSPINGAEPSCKPESCPGILLFLGAYLDRQGLSEEEALQCIAELREKIPRTPVQRADLSAIGVRCKFDGMSRALMGTIDFISKRLVTFNKKKEARGDKPSLYYQEIYNNRARMFCHTPYILEERLVNAVLSGDEEAAVLCLKEINRSGNKAVLASDSVRSAKNSVICTCVFLARAAIQAGVSPDEAFALSDANIRRIEEFTGKHAALKYEEDLLLQFVKLIKNNRGREFSIVVHRAVQYIDSHLSERLRLADIADYAEVSPQYLSGVFSKEMRMPITNYISMRKIQESTHFISQKKYSITDVALLYGFSSQSHYIQVFKKVMGTTPGKYRGLQAVM